MEGGTVTSPGQSICHIEILLLWSLDESIMYYMDGCGAVYRARHVRTGHQAAIKAIGADKITQDKILQSLQSEINILRSVVHPNIVKLLDYERRDVRAAFFGPCPCSITPTALLLSAHGTCGSRSIPAAMYVFPIFHNELRSTGGRAHPCALARKQQAIW